MTIYRGAGAGDRTFPLLTAAAQDDRISYRALGVLTSVMSRPRNWRVGGIDGLASKGGREGEAAVARALLQLERYGYLRRVRVRIGRNDPEGRRPGSVITVWDMTDDPSLLVTTGTQLPRGGQPRGGQPRPAGPQAGEPGDLEMERGFGETPPPTPPEPAPDRAEVDELVGVVVEQIQGKAPAPAPRTLRQACAGMLERGWKPDQVRKLVREHDWSGARAGAVVTLLRTSGNPSSPARRRAVSRPAWCGRCDEPTRLLEVPQAGSLSRTRTVKCPTCHPSSAGRPS